MSREKEDGGDLEINFHGDETDNVVLDPEEEKSLDPALRTRKVNTKAREGVKAENSYQARSSLRGYLVRVSTVINRVKSSIADARERENVREAVKNLGHAWARYSDTYQS